jgi:hypothetical protein
MSKPDRVHITLTRPMRVALEDLAYRNGGTLASEARRILRAGLDRTMRSPNVQMRLRSEGYTYVGPGSIEADLADASPEE